ncbi:hypothetical protein ACN23B_22640 [Anabaena sp. FACHB-709]|nr:MULTISPECIES: hypothetical protein [Nostocaceae]
MWINIELNSRSLVAKHSALSSACSTIFWVYFIILEKTGDRLQ